MDNLIIDFLDKQPVASLSCVNENCEPYSFSCFFAFCKQNNLLYFKSSENSYHINLLLKNRAVSGTVLPKSLNTLKFTGIQFRGVLLNANDILSKGALIKYHQKFPFAFAVPGTVFTIQLNQIKMTGSILGKRQKLEWSRTESNIEV